MSIVLFNSGLRPATLLKKRLWHRCFPANFARFLRTPFLTEYLRWLLLFYRLFLDYFLLSLLLCTGLWIFRLVSFFSSLLSWSACCSVYFNVKFGEIRHWSGWLLQIIVSVIGIAEESLGVDFLQIDTSDIDASGKYFNEIVQWDRLLTICIFFIN